MQVEDLSDTVADLKQRVEALERELAAMKTPEWKDAQIVRFDDQKDLHAKWDEGRYSEQDFA